VAIVYIDRGGSLASHDTQATAGVPYQYRILQPKYNKGIVHADIANFYGEGCHTYLVAVSEGRGCAIVQTSSHYARGGQLSPAGLLLQYYAQERM
jgi:hypothetical protein